MGNDLDLGKKVWYKCPTCQKDKWALEAFVGHKCYECMGLKGMADASNAQIKKTDPDFLARRERYCTMSNGWALHPKSTFKYSNYKVLFEQNGLNNLTDNMIIDALKEVSPNNVSKYRSMISSSVIHNTIGRRCIKLWTFESDNIYHSINKSLNNDSYYDLKKWMPIIKGISSFVVKTPTTCPLITYRGSKIVAEQYQKWIVGQIYRMPQIVASSKKESVANNFIKKGGFKVVFEINNGCCNAVFIEKYTAIKGEEEVLLPPYTAIKCLSKNINSKTIHLKVLDNKYAEQNAPSRYV